MFLFPFIHCMNTTLTLAQLVHDTRSTRIPEHHVLQRLHDEAEPLHPAVSAVP